MIVASPDPVTAALKTALARFVASSSCPLYLRTAATAWLNR